MFKFELLGRGAKTICIAVDISNITLGTISNIQPLHATRIHVPRIHESRNVGTALCTGVFHPFETFKLAAFELQDFLFIAARSVR